jgi:SARP family transcriptional regulator, regulator of embCAB operon
MARWYVGPRMMERYPTRIHLCGRMTVRIDARRVEDALPGRQGRLLLAYLVVNRHRPLTRDALMAALWEEAAPASPDSALSALLSKLRRAVGPDVLAGGRDPGLTLPKGAWVDTEAAVDAVHRAESALRADDWGGVYAGGRIAVYIAERGFMAGFQGRWVEERRRELEDVRVRGHECCARTALHSGRSELPLGERHARALIELAPYRETGYLLLMDILAARGSVPEALRVYEQLRRLLRDELGVAPGREVQDVHQRLLRAGVRAPS